jgi:hypothetical protein
MDNLSGTHWSSWYAWMTKADTGQTETRACNCVGPRPGQPVCPCRMPALKVVDGRYVEVIDHGPATVRGAA